MSFHDGGIWGTCDRLAALLASLIFFSGLSATENEDIIIIIIIYDDARWWDDRASGCSLLPIFMVMRWERTNRGRRRRRRRRRRVFGRFLNIVKVAEMREMAIVSISDDLAASLFWAHGSHLISVQFWDFSLAIINFALSVWIGQLSSSACLSSISQIHLCIWFLGGNKPNNNGNGPQPPSSHNNCLAKRVYVFARTQTGLKSVRGANN